MGYIPEKMHACTGRGVEDMVFPCRVIEKIKCRNARGHWSMKKEVEFPGVIKKSWWNFLGFLALEIPVGCNTILWNFLGWSFISGIFMGKLTNLKIPRVFFKKVCCHTPHPSCSPYLCFSQDGIPSPLNRNICEYWSCKKCCERWYLLDVQQANVKQ